MHLFDGFQHIIGARVHCLTSLDQIIYTQILKHIAQAFARRNGNKAVLLQRSARLCLFKLLCGELLGILDQLLLMLFPHIINLHTGQGAVGKPLFKHFTGMIRMHMHLYDLIIRHDHDRIAHGHKIVLKGKFLLFGHRFVKKDDKLCTISEFDLFFCLFRDLCHAAAFGSSRIEGCIVNLLAFVSVDRSAHYFDKALSARIDHAGFLENGKQIRRSGKNLLCSFQNIHKERIQIRDIIAYLSCLLRRLTGNSKDRPFLRFHDCFVCCLHRFPHRIREDHSVKLLVSFDSSCKPSEKL